VSNLQKAPRDGTKWRFIPTCAWCRIDTQFIWKICNRHQGTVPQKHFSYVYSKSSNKSEFSYYRGKNKIKKLFEPSLNHILTKALSIVKFSLFNIHNNLLLSSKLLMFLTPPLLWQLLTANQICSQFEGAYICSIFTIKLSHTLMSWRTIRPPLLFWYFMNFSACPRSSSEDFLKYLQKPGKATSSRSK
jgi:hypothetical protein